MVQQFLKRNGYVIADRRDSLPAGPILHTYLEQLHPGESGLEALEAAGARFGFVGRVQPSERPVVLIFRQFLPSRADGGTLARPLARTAAGPSAIEAPFNRPLLDRPNRLLQRWRGPRLLWLLLLHAGRWVVARLAPALASDAALSEERLDLLKRRYFPRDQWESVSFRPQQLITEGLGQPAGWQDLALGRYQAPAAGQTARLDLSQALLDDLGAPAAAGRWARLRAALAAETVRHILRYRSAEFYGQSLAIAWSEAVAVGFYRLSASQPRWLARISQRLLLRTPELYLRLGQDAVQRTQPQLAGQSELARVWSQPDTAINAAYHAWAQKPGPVQETTLALALLAWLQAVPEPDQRLIELTYASELLSRLAALPSTAMASWQQAERTQHLLLPRALLSRPSLAGRAQRLLETWPFLKTLDLDRPLRRPRLRFSPGQAA